MTPMKDTHASAYVEPPLTEQRLDNQWEHIATRLERRSVLELLLGPLGAAAGAAAITAAILIVVLGGRRAPATADGFVMTSLGEGKQELAFADGSRVTVAEGGRLRVDRATLRDVQMHLEAGRARFEVKHDVARRFSVIVAEIEVIDRGTRFEIVRGDDARPGVEVRVEEGEVLLSDPSHREPRRLSAGESWSNRAAEAAATTGDSVTNVASGAAVPALRADQAASAPGIAPNVPGIAPSEPVPAVSSRSSEARAKIAEASRGNVESRAARELFETATTAKLDGRLRDAADAFDALRVHHRADGHAALAALELGRLRLDHLGDPSGALAAFEDSVKLGPRAPFREEAEARIVDALAAAGRASDCARAREQFLARHPRSVHAAAVAGKCTGR